MGSGGGGSTSTVDKEYNRRMADIYEASHEIGEEYHNLYLYGDIHGPRTEYKLDGQWVDKDTALAAREVDPYARGIEGLETRDAEGYRSSTQRTGQTTRTIYYDPDWKMVSEIPSEYRLGDEWVSREEAEKRLAEGGKTWALSDLEQRQVGELGGPGSQLGLEQDMIASQQRLLPLQTDLHEQSMQAEQRLLPLQTDIQEQSMQAMQGLIPEAEKFAHHYMDRMRTGVDADQWAGRAATDVASQYRDAQAGLSRQAGRMGVDPSSGMYAHQARGLGMDQARTSALAQQQARRAADDVNYQRWGQAGQLAARGLGGF